MSKVCCGVKVGDTVIVAGDDADEYSEYIVEKIDGMQAKLEGMDGNFYLRRLTVIHSKD